MTMATPSRRGGATAYDDVLLAEGLVVDVTPGNGKALGIRPLVLPTAIPDASAHNELRIGMSPKQADGLLGPARR